MIETFVILMFGIIIPMGLMFIFSYQVIVIEEVRKENGGVRDDILEKE